MKNESLRAKKRGTGKVVPIPLIASPSTLATEFQLTEMDQPSLLRLVGFRQASITAQFYVDLGEDFAATDVKHLRVRRINDVGDTGWREGRPEGDDFSRRVHVKKPDGSSSRTLRIIEIVAPDKSWAKQKIWFNIIIRLGEGDMADKFFGCSTGEFSVRMDELESVRKK